MWFFSQLAGQIDTCLSETGRQQALMVGSRLQNERWTHVFASDLNRATQTAQAIVEANKYNHCSLIKDRRLRERVGYQGFFTIATRVFLPFVAVHLHCHI